MIDYDAPGNCGTPGRKSGLETIFSRNLISYIPFRQLVEVPFHVYTTSNCMNYVNLMLIIQSACESKLTYQYGTTLDVVTGDVAVDYNTTYGISNSTVSFSVRWKAPVAMSADRTSLIDGASTVTSSDIRSWAIAIIVLNIVIFLIMILLFWKVFSILNKQVTPTRDTQLHELYEEEKLNESSFRASKEPLLSSSPTSAVSSVKFNGKKSNTISLDKNHV